MPPKNAANEATKGGIPLTIKMAAIEAPNVIEPSAVISGNRKIRNVIRTPKARSERIIPIVRELISRVIFIFL